MKKLIITSFMILLSVMSFSQNNYSINCKTDTQWNVNGVDLNQSTILSSTQNDLSVCFWIKPGNLNPTNTQHVIRSKYWEEISSSGVIGFNYNDTQPGSIYFGSGTGTSHNGVYSNSIADGNWHFISGVRKSSNGELTLYIDGQPLPVVLSFVGPLNGLNEWEVGAQWANTINHYIGLVDELTIWTIALDSITIDNIMNCGPIGTEIGLAHAFMFEEGTGNFTYDLTANGGLGYGGYDWDSDVPQNNCAIMATSELTSNNTNIYPNPAIDNINVTIPNNHSVRIINMLGQIVINLNASTTIPTDLIGASGIYFVQFISDNNVISTEKLIIR